MEPMMKRENAGVREAIRRLGSIAEVARRMHVSSPAVLGWLQRNIPAERAKELSDKTGVPLAHIRPDLWGTAK